eukprot:5354417-Pyramimonas_sp.AAC.1
MSRHTRPCNPRWCTTSSVAAPSASACHPRMTCSTCARWPISRSQSATASRLAPRRRIRPPPLGQFSARAQWTSTARPQTGPVCAGARAGAAG